MNQKDWQRAYEPLPDGLESRVKKTLAQLEEAAPARRFTLKTAVIVLALLLALGGVAYAVFHSQVAELFGWFYGDTWQQELQAGDISTETHTYRLGDVVYTIEESVYKTEGDYHGLYSVIRLAPAEDSHIILLPEDYSVNEPVGFLLHYGTQETIPEDTPSYAELSKQTGAKIIMARLTLETLYQNGQPCPADVGESWLAQPDGSVLGMLEIVGDAVERADAYQLKLWVSNWEVTTEGEWLREEPENTWLKTEWDVTIAPTLKGE